MSSNEESPLPDPSAALEDRFSSAIREIGIPPCPSILTQVVAEMRQPDPDFRTLALAIGADVGLSAALLKMVNSPFFGYRNKARTVHDALMMLGLDLTASTVAGIVLRRVVPAGPQLERFWDASARVAQLSAWLVGQLGVRDGIRVEDAYTFGLFRDCGIPILMRKLPGYADTLKLANAERELPFTDVEERQHPTNHAVIGSLMAQSWWLPEVTVGALRHHHDLFALYPGAIGVQPGSQRLIAIAQLAEHYMQHLTGLSRTCEWDKLGADSLKILQMDTARMDALLPAAAEVLEHNPLQD